MAEAKLYVSPYFFKQSIPRSSTIEAYRRVPAGFY